MMADAREAGQISFGPRREDLASGQLGDDRGECVCEVGAEDEVGETDLFPAALDFLGGRRRVIGEIGQRVRRPERSGVGVGGRHKRRASAADDRHVERELDVPDGLEVAC
jgi:hypothetical protein